MLVSIIGSNSIIYLFAKRRDGAGRISRKIWDEASKV